MADRALVTGAAGAIGEAVVGELVRRGFEVDAWDLVEPCPGRGVTAAVVDLRRPVDPALVRDYRLVVHLASVTENRDDRSGLLDHLSSLSMTAHLLDALTERVPGAVVTTSSQLVYASGPQHPDERAPVAAATGFAAAKIASEAFVEAYGHRSGVPTAVFRLANIVGPATRRGVIHDFVRRAGEAAGTTGVVGITGSTHHRRSFLSLEDCASAIVELSDALPGAALGQRVVNVANRDSVSIADVADVVAEVTGVTFTVEEHSDELAWRGDAGTVLPDTARLTATGWSPRATSREAVHQAAAGLWASWAHR
ncbi:NAD-dependent epimerase/dehydratase family protein [Streptomyces griseoloalbus]|uniref:UDP-glucose 4-epimerase n=1 Tax=Streptomyces griseoloalbus TaxID=67303 RepID=A0A7W8BTG6_9ACTN|nr:NAD-dependent epimerase/dehydratase family protein [Streptomyces albaduncus]MBB5128141.1 UDP-glucose 4-epimerase [Streptomyces albaduncus]GGV87797.1 UDP-glucose 4-epimerase [Streptomyces griseoloalbus]GGW53429.1 UDP-glucose 4-epimerase [Streptomyces albaduncus]